MERAGRFSSRGWALSHIRTGIALGLTTALVQGADFEKEKLDNWPQWRGPYANGVVPRADPPIRWSRSEHIKWQTKLVGEGSATPIVWNHWIYVLAAVDTGKKADSAPTRHPDAITEPPGTVFQFIVMCLERETGRVLWQRVAQEEAPHEGRHETHTYAAGSPATDGQRLYVSFGSRGVFAYTMEGQLLWERDLGRMRTRNGWGEASTPVVHERHLFLVWDQEDDSFLYCLDTESGETRWKVPRDEPTNWSTPFVAAGVTPAQLIVNGTHRARGYDLATGQVIWECGELSVNAIPSPVVDKDVAYCMSGYKKPVVYAIPLSARGDVSESEAVRWTYRRDTPYVSSPLIHEDLLYMIKDRSAILTILKTEDAKPVEEASRIEGLGDIYASPILANHRLYYVDRQGKTAVIKAGRSGRTQVINDLNDTIDASPVAVGKQLFLRSHTMLYCVEGVDPPESPPLVP